MNFLSRLDAEEFLMKFDKFTVSAIEDDIVFFLLV